MADYNLSPNVQDNTFIELKVWCQKTEQVAMNYYHYFLQHNNPAVPYLDTSLAAFMEGLAAGVYIPALASVSLFLGVSVQVVGSQTIAPEPPTHETYYSSTIKYSKTLRGGGGDAGGLLPRNVAGVLRKKTAKPGPRGRGRVYIPFPTTNHITGNGVPHLDYMALVGAIGDALCDESGITPDGAPVTLFPVILHSDQDPILSPRITDIEASPKWGSIHRRGDYGQANTEPF